MGRKHRHGVELNVRTENYFRHRDLEEHRRTVLTLEEFESELRERYGQIVSRAASDLVNLPHVLDFAESEITKDEEKVVKEMMNELFDWKRVFVEAFVRGFEGRRHYVVTDALHKLFQRVYVESIIAVKYDVAYKWRGYLVQFYLDKRFDVIVNEKPEVAEALLKAVRYSNRLVELIEESEGEIISMAHEYLSWLRRERCHISAMLIKVTPATMKFLKDYKGNMYTAINLNAKHLAYNPYTRNVMPQPYWLIVLNRRKGSERFSLKADGGWNIIRLDTEVVTAIDFRDRAYMTRTIAECILRPYVILKDRTRGIGRPELRFKIHHCSLYAKPFKRTKSYKLSKLDPNKRFYEKRKIYLRHVIL